MCVDGCFGWVGGCVSWTSVVDVCVCGWWVLWMHGLVDVIVVFSGCVFVINVPLAIS